MDKKESGGEESALIWEKTQECTRKYEIRFAWKHEDLHAYAEVDFDGDVILRVKLFFGMSDPVEIRGALTLRLLHQLLNQLESEKHGSN